MLNIDKINSCLQCSNHCVINDPDPYIKDSNEKAVVCSITINNDIKIESPYLSDKQPYQIIASSCNPKNLKKETSIPYWCPISRATK